MEGRHISREINKDYQKIDDEMSTFLSQNQPILVIGDLRSKRDRCHDLRIEAETAKKMFSGKSVNEKYSRKIEKLQLYENYADTLITKTEEYHVKLKAI